MIAWHYTTLDKFELIIESESLIPATAGVQPPEKPILWFSTSKYFEKSALKGVQDESGRIRQATLEEMYDLGGGLCRIGCPVSQLLYGENLRKAAKMQSIVWRQLAKKGKAFGANPGDWWGFVGESMSASGLMVQNMDENMKWGEVIVMSDEVVDEQEQS